MDLLSDIPLMLRRIYHLPTNLSEYLVNRLSLFLFSLFILYYLYLNILRIFDKVKHYFNYLVVFFLESVTPPKTLANCSWGANRHSPPYILARPMIWPSLNTGPSSKLFKNLFPNPSFYHPNQHLNILRIFDKVKHYFHFFSIIFHP